MLELQNHTIPNMYMWLYIKPNTDSFEFQGKIFKQVYNYEDNTDHHTTEKGVAIRKDLYDWLKKRDYKIILQCKDDLADYSLWLDISEQDELEFKLKF